jgi:drug/metabolite transporter (DMT)-like permease
LTEGRPLALAAAALAGLQVGAATFVTHFVIAEAGPASLALFRYLIALFIILPVAARRLLAMRRADIAPIALLGVGQFGLLVLFLNISLRDLDPGRVTLIFATFPILTMVFAVAIGRERFTWRGTTGIVMTVLGVALSIGLSLDLHDGHAGQWLSAGAAFLSAIIGAVCSIGYRPYLRRNPTIAVSFVAMAAAVAFLVVPSSMEGLFSEWAGFSAAGWAAIAFIGASSGVGYFLWLHALSALPASNVAAFLGLSPMLAVALSAVFLAAPYTPADAAGLVLVLVGLVVALWHDEARLTPGGN